ncbi:hypothetical protein F4780DRAFT_130683 [Xylariomycetidae sp. FL0641]|nr:hypothetical protein F4780DRAFT_130683 [Xylariomycetidae sp. FL0641]
MEAHQALHARSEEDRFFDLLCNAVKTSPGFREEKLRQMIGEGGELEMEWAAILSLAASTPIGAMSDAELLMAARLHLSPVYNNPESAQRDPVETRVYVPAEVQEGLDALETYTSLLKECSNKYRVQVGRAIAAAHLPPPSSNSTIQARIRALRARRSVLDAAARDIRKQTKEKMKVNHAIMRAEAGVLKKYPDFFREHYLSRSQAPKGVNESVFDAHDVVLSKISAAKDAANKAAVRKKNTESLGITYHTNEKGEDKTIPMDDKDSLVNDARRHANDTILAITTRCHVQLDQAFVEANLTYNVAKDSERSDYGDAIASEHSAVLDEIKSLWEEVIPVAHMAVEEQFLKPIIEAIGRQNIERGYHEAMITSYTSAMMRFLNTHLEFLATRLQILLYHHQTLYTASKMAQSHLESGYKAALTECYDDAVPNPATVVAQRVLPMKSTALDVLYHAMEVYGSIPLALDPPKDPKNFPATRQHSWMSDFAIIREATANTLAKDVQALFEAAVKANILDTELGAQGLIEAIVADSSSGLGTPGCVHQDQQVEHSIASLDHAIDDIRNALAELTVGGPPGAPNMPDGGCGCLANAPSTPGPVNAPDFVLEAYKKTCEILAAKTGPDCMEPNTNVAFKCPRCSRCVHFLELLRRWGQ